LIFPAAFTEGGRGNIKGRRNLKNLKTNGGTDQGRKIFSQGAGKKLKREK